MCVCVWEGEGWRYAPHAGLERLPAAQNCAADGEVVARLAGVHEVVFQDNPHTARHRPHIQFVHLLLQLDFLCPTGPARPVWDMGSLRMRGHVRMWERGLRDVWTTRWCFLVRSPGNPCTLWAGYCRRSGSGTWCCRRARRPAPRGSGWVLGLCSSAQTEPEVVFVVGSWRGVLPGNGKEL